MSTHHLKALGDLFSSLTDLTSLSLIKIHLELEREVPNLGIKMLQKLSLLEELELDGYWGLFPEGVINELLGELRYVTLLVRPYHQRTWRFALDFFG